MDRAATRRTAQASNDLTRALAAATAGLHRDGERGYDAAAVRDERAGRSAGGRVGSDGTSGSRAGSVSGIGILSGTGIVAGSTSMILRGSPMSIRASTVEGTTFAASMGRCRAPTLIDVSPPPSVARV
jgi:hypothetical protein